MILYRPVGTKELQLMAKSGFKCFPPRLPEQPIFYPVLSQEYAAEIASNWNVKYNDDHVGYVTQFEVDDEFVKKYEPHTVGASYHRELWVPAEELVEFNKHLIGTIRVIEVFGVPLEASSTDERINVIEQAVHTVLKLLGFKKFGRTLHRFVSGDISQVISFQCGQAYRDETNLMWVNTGIRVPESFERCFYPKNTETHYPEYKCNIRSRFGIIATKDIQKEKTFDLNGDLKQITKEILQELTNDVITVFETLSSREAILAHRREYPWFDTMNRHLILLEEAMIYGRAGNLEKARELFETYYSGALKDCKQPGHIRYLDDLRGKLRL